MQSKQENKKQKKNRCEEICTDPQGSYTGVPKNPKEMPVQDVDDL